MTVSLRPEDLLAFWREAGPDRWFTKDSVFDAECRRLFESVHHAGARGELQAWEATADGALALVLLFDQIPRNLYRGSAHAYATDPLARRVARMALARGGDQAIEPALRQFFYLPFQHSELRDDQERSVRLFEELADVTGDPDTAKWARHHRDIIVRFGRFPHRNRALGRDTSPAEAAFLASGGFTG